MAGMGPVGTTGVSQEDEWRTQAFRMKVVAQIDNAIRAASNPTQKSSMEMEKHVYEKARHREEYLALVARLILHMKGFNKKEGHPGKMQPSQQPDPMAVLRGLTMGQPVPGPRPPQQQMPPLGQHPQLGVQQTQQQLQMTLARQQQANQLSMRQQQANQLSMQRMNNPMGGPPQQGPPPMSQQPMMQQQKFNQQQQQQAAMQAQQLQNMQNDPQQAVKMQGQMTIQQSQQLNAQRQQQQQAASMAAAQASLQAQQAAQQAAQQQRPPMSPYGGHPYNMMSPQSAGAPSPSAASSSQPMASPVSYLHPSPSPQHSVQSPASNRGPASVPSPASGLNTLANPSSVRPGSVGGPGSVGASTGGPGSAGPGSVGPVPSPQGRSRTPQQTPGTQSAEDIAYYEKWKQLAVYIDPLKRMINKASREGDTTKDNSLNKMKNLLEILCNPNKKVNLNMLKRCEQVLVKMDFNKQISDKPQNIGQNLLEAISQHAKSPVLNHTLHRTFGPALNALHGTPIPHPARSASLTQTLVPNIVQGEVARLPTKFRVSLDPAHHTGGKDIHLICKLEDKRLPSVPPISLTVPEKYPDVSPQYDTSASAQDYVQTSFLTSVHKHLSSQMMRLPDKFSLTQVLDTWEMSIRKACINLVTVN